MDPTVLRQRLCKNIICHASPEMPSRARDCKGGQCYPYGRTNRTDAQFSATEQGNAWLRMEGWVQISNDAHKRIDLSSKTPTRSKQPGVRGRDRGCGRRNSHVPSLFTVLPSAGPARRKRRSRWRDKARANDAAAMDEGGRCASSGAARGWAP